VPCGTSANFRSRSDSTQARRAAVAMAPAVARLMARELRRDQSWEDQQISEFKQTASHFMADL